MQGNLLTNDILALIRGLAWKELGELRIKIGKFVTFCWIFLNKLNSILNKLYLSSGSVSSMQKPKRLHMSWLIGFAAATTYSLTKLQCPYNVGVLKEKVSFVILNIRILELFIREVWIFHKSRLLFKPF